MSGLGDLDLSGYGLDDVEDYFASMMDNIKPEEEGKPSCEMSPGINFDEDAFIWEDKYLSEGIVLSQSSMIQFVEDQAPITTASPSNDTNIPNIDILQAAINELPVSPSPSEATSSDDSETRYNANPLVTLYGLTDDRLSDISLKKLRTLCKGDEDHFNQLKAYRRTCLNRHYARSSRAKSQNKTQCMSTELEKARNTISKLTKENQEKDSIIKYLQLELQILRPTKK